MEKLLLDEVKILDSFKRIPDNWWILVERTKANTKLHFFKGEDLYHTCHNYKNDFNHFSNGWKYNEFTYTKSWLKGYGIKHWHSNFKTYSNERHYRIFLNKLIRNKKANLSENLTICIIDEL